MESFVIDSYDQGRLAYGRGYAVVAVDVIRATTTAVTAVALGRRCFPAPSVEAALELARKLAGALLAGEMGGVMPPGFDLNNSPAEIAARADAARPLVLLSSSGTRLLCAGGEAEGLYLASFRNAAASVAHVAGRYPRIALVGAATHGEFREEDQICCAWMGAALAARGYAPADARTAAIVGRWQEAPPTACLGGNSAAYLERSGQRQDLEFILAHINDIQEAYLLSDGEVVRANGRPAVVAGSSQ